MSKREYKLFEFECIFSTFDCCRHFTPPHTDATPYSHFNPVAAKFKRIDQSAYCRTLQTVSPFNQKIPAPAKQPHCQTVSPTKQVKPSTPCNDETVQRASENKVIDNHISAGIESPSARLKTISERGSKKMEEWSIEILREARGQVREVFDRDDLDFDVECLVCRVEERLAERIHAALEDAQPQTANGFSYTCAHSERHRTPTIYIPCQDCELVHVPAPAPATPKLEANEWRSQFFGVLDETNNGTDEQIIKIIERRFTVRWYDRLHIAAHSAQWREEAKQWGVLMTDGSVRPIGKARRQEDKVSRLKARASQGLRLKALVVKRVAQMRVVTWEDNN